MIRRWFFAGLAVWIPLGATLFVIRFVFDLLDNFLLLIPPPWRPKALFGFDIPGLGAIFFVLLVLLTGGLVANYLGEKLLIGFEQLLGRIPLVRSVYGSIKKLAETVFSQESSSFKKVVLIEYPRTGIWSIAFQAGDAIDEINARAGQECVSVFVPTTPNPTSGFLMQIPRADVIVLDLTVEEGMRLIISLGMVPPDKVVSTRLSPFADAASLARSPEAS